MAGLTQRAVLIQCHEHVLQAIHPTALSPLQVDVGHKLQLAGTEREVLCP